MDLTIDLCLKRADNELVLANIIQRISVEEQLKKDVFKIPEDFTFYSAVINHSYYTIFHSAKAYLMSKGVGFSNKQGQHQKVYQRFKKNVKKGTIDNELLKIYDAVMIRADELLGILEKEREKRGEFTYEKLPQANMEPANDSLANAQKFYRHIYALISGK